VFYKQAFTTACLFFWHVAVLKDLLMAMNAASML
jgi:hypothetical protein